LYKNAKKYFINDNIQDGIFSFILSVSLLFYGLINHYSLNKAEWKTSPYLFPILISVIIIFLSFSLLNYGFNEIKAETKNIKVPIKIKDIITTVVSSIAYYKIMSFTGFVIATILFLAFMFLYFGERRTWYAAFISMACSFGIYGLFAIFLKVMLP
jgi:cation transport ATPase